MRRVTPTMLLAATLLLPIGLADGPRTVEGDGEITCTSSTPAVEMAFTVYVVENPDAPTGHWLYFDESSRFNISVDHVERVVLTVSWEPVDAMAEEMEVILSGNTSCGRYYPNYGCGQDVAQGRSPITVELNHTEASNMTLRASLSLPNECNYGHGPNVPLLWLLPDECRLPPAHIVRNQPFHYTWTIYEQT